MQTISNSEREATIMHDNYVIFSVSVGGGEYSPSRRKSSRGYKTRAGAERAARRWVESGK